LKAFAIEFSALAESVYIRGSLNKRTSVQQISDYETRQSLSAINYIKLFFFTAKSSAKTPYLLQPA
jgi:hypothetical protein